MRTFNDDDLEKLNSVFRETTEPKRKMNQQRNDVQLSILYDFMNDRRKMQDEMKQQRNVVSVCESYVDMMDEEQTMKSEIEQLTREINSKRRRLNMIKASMQKARDESNKILKPFIVKQGDERTKKSMIQHCTSLRQQWDTMKRGRQHDALRSAANRTLVLGYKHEPNDVVLLLLRGDASSATTSSARSNAVFEEVEFVSYVNDRQCIVRLPTGETSMVHQSNILFYDVSFTADFDIDDEDNMSTRKKQRR